MLISKKNIAELHNVNQKHCVSIFIPTHRAGKEVLQEEDRLNLKIQLKNVKNKLSHNGLNNDIIHKMTIPVQQLIDDGSFWRKQSDGLAIFFADGFFRKYILPIHFYEFNFIANSFYLKPLLPMFVDDGKFNLLTLELGNVNLFECTQHSFTEITIDDLIPNNIHDRVGYDYEEKNLQFRTQQTGSSNVMYHGQEATTGKRKNEIKKYVRAINDGIKPILNEENIPMIIATQDYIFDIYKQVNTYNQLSDQNLSIDFGNSDIYEVHELAWQKMAPTFEQTKKNKIKEFLEVQGTGKTAVGINKVLNATFLGRIDTLFCENKADIYGTYSEANETLTITESEESKDTISLMNLAAIETFLKGGNVYLLDKEDMPNQNAKINALYRY